MRLVARIADAFGVDLSLRWFFDHPTIAELATLVDASPRSERVAEDRILPQR
ncbi:MAG: acyl carrier protein [Vulcanimicrobiaceae bacterium]